MANPFSFLTSYIAKKLQRREMRKKGLVQSKKSKRLKQDAGIAPAVERSKTIGIFILLAVWCVCVAAMLATPYDAMEFSPVLKQKAATTVRSDFDFSYVDKRKTDDLKKQAGENEPHTYNLDLKSSKKSIDAVKTLFKLIPMADNPPEELSKRFPLSLAAYQKLSPGLASALKLTLGREESRNKIIGLVESKIYHGVFPKALQIERVDGRLLKIRKGDTTEIPKPANSIPSKREAVEEISTQAVAELAPENREPIKRALATMLSEAIKANLSYDPKSTELDRNRAAESVPPAKIVVRKDNIILKKGEVIDQKTLERCNAYLAKKREKQAHSILREKFISSAIIALFLIAISGLYINHVHPEVTRSNKNMGLIATVVIINLLLNFLAVDVFHRLAAAFDLHPGAVFCAIPLAMGSIVLSVMIGLRVAFFAGLFISFITAIQLGNSFPIAVTGMVVSSVAALAVRHRRNYKSYFTSTLLAVLLAVPLASLINVKIFFSSTWTPLRDIILTGAANAFVVALLALAVLFILEPLFQITSDMSLLVLCDYNHPLLKRLQLEAPGTYHHSLVVATLAEQASEAVDANPIRARAVSLFHDIGKMEKPGYFTENQMSDESKHTKLTPTMSALVIINHVKDGVDMAIKHKLKRIIRDGIEQHHGTDIVAYFYQQAIEDARLKGTSVDENDFRYPGPLPYEKEVVILSLADACEAASRSIQKPTPAKIDALVWEIIRKRIRSGQLDDADLSFGELAKIRKSFVSTLTTMMHGRIAYPKGDEEEKNEDDLFVAAREQQAKAESQKNKKNGD
jgi:putative nucleotidyltransferase with HDIG domain